MKNFKQIAEDCLAGKLSGVFILRNGGSWKSNTLSRYSIEGRIIPDYYVLGKGIVLDSNGLNMEIKERVQHFIPDMKTDQITIDIPEGKVPVMKQTENEVVITWKEKQLTYNQIYASICKDEKAISPVSNVLVNDTNTRFLVKTNVLRKLTNIRNYFGKPESDGMGYYISSPYSAFKPYIDKAVAASSEVVVFAKKEHAEQAIKMLGNELKLLFEPW